VYIIGDPPGNAAETQPIGRPPAATHSRHAKIDAIRCCSVKSAKTAGTVAHNPNYLRGAAPFPRKYASAGPECFLFPRAYS
jgi:hypothetical protein